MIKLEHIKQGDLLRAGIGRCCLELEFTVLFDLVRQCASEAICAGIQPTEVWLGPKEFRILEVAMMNLQFAEGPFVHTNDNQSAMIRDSMEGASFMGLRVRLMAKDGVRVGISWPNEHD